MNFTGSARLDTYKKGGDSLEGRFFPFRPYHKNIARSILKEAKYFLEDTTGCKTSLHYLRDKDGREVDFLVVIDNKPVQMIEVKVSNESFCGKIIPLANNIPEVRGWK